MESVELKRSVERGVIVLHLSYNDEFALKAWGEDPLSTLLVNKYNDGMGGPSCVVVVVMGEETAVGFILRGLFALYKVVSKHYGRLICVGYSKRSICIEELAACGLGSLKGFSLFDSLEEAIEELTKLRR